MCGIAGIFTTELGPVDPALLQRMTGAIRHRGPDGDGFHVEPGVGLGHRRLAIIDIGGGAQPMYNENGSVAIVFNGEIYNHADLRPELEAAGHVFRSRCDTEAIIHAWEEWGPDCVRRLAGMFAFAIWDRNRQQLFLARDHIGKKPLYYAWLADGRFVFASEMQGLTAVPELPRRLSPGAIEDFFTFGYIPDPQTIYAGVWRLPPAHSLLLSRGDSRRPEPKRYWRARFAPHDVGEQEATASLVSRLRESVRQRLMADVPLGAFLSGGVDSSATVAFAAELKSAPLSTFTIGMEGREDERGYAEMVAARYETAHHSEATHVDYVEAARDQAWLFGEPFGDISSVPTHRVCALARRDVTVAISGDGGDEVFAGYRRYQWHRLAEAVRTLLPATVRRNVIGGLARIYPKLDRAPRWLRAKYTLTEISLDSALGYFRTLCKSHADRRHSLYAPAMEDAIDGYDPSSRIIELMAEAEVDDPVLQAEYVDINSYLPGDILVKVDRASMANSLEVRAPLLDYRFIEWSATLPSTLKMRGTEGKYIFKRALEPHLPREVLYRTKQGFAFSQADQFRAAIARVRERVLGPAMLDSALFDRGAIMQVVREHEAGTFDHSGLLWLLLVFEGFLHMEAGGIAAESSEELSA
ncbi:MAG: asparagine synthase (glutamine-hydrolyzing) [Acetobacteraceae bacterium]|nr:asparagine synthase (glutamine-hydrolyzing) [Acetobacteraceae bacterium]